MVPRSRGGDRRVSVARDALMDQIRRHNGVVLVEAPAGYGKSTLLAQLASNIQATVVDLSREGPDPDRLLGTPPEPNPSVALVDTDGIATESAEIARLLDDRGIATVVLASRLFPVGLREEIDHLALLDIGASELSLGLHEVEQLARNFVPPEVAEEFSLLVSPWTEGWPVAVETALSVLAKSRDQQQTIRELAASPSYLRPYVQVALGRLDSSESQALIQLSHLGPFTDSTAEALMGAGAADRILRAGFPLLRVDEQWLRMPCVAREALRAAGELKRETGRRLAPVLVANGALVTALRSLVRTGDFDEAANLLAGIGPSHLDEVDQHALLAVVDLLSEQATRIPILYLIRARIERNLARLGACHESLRMLKQTAEQLGDEELATEARVEQLLGAALSGDGQATLADMESLQSALGSGKRQLSLRLREARAVLLGQNTDPDCIEEASGLLREVAVQWELLGEESRAASTLRMLAAGPLSHLGRYREAQEVLRLAVQLTWNKLFDRTLTVELSCRIDALAGDFGSHARNVSEADCLAKGQFVPWIEAYLCWSKMQVAAMQGRPQDLASSFHRTEQLLGELRDQQTGGIFYAEAASLFAVVGEVGRANSVLATAEQHPERQWLEMMIATVVVHARRGGLSEAGAAWRELQASEQLPPDRHWRPALELLCAGVPPGGELGLPSLQEVHGAVQSLGLEDLVDAVGLRAEPPHQSDQPTRPPMTVTTLGEFTVNRDGEAVSLAPGHVSCFLKLLAVRHNGVTAEVAIDVLWPDESEAVGRRRLKNIVNRLRRTVGQENIERSPGRVRLCPEVSVDLGIFDRLVSDAQASTDDDGSEFVEIAIEALDLYRGELLPGDPYDEWLQMDRLTAQSRAASLLDRLLDVDKRLGPSAPWLLEATIRVDPDNDRRFLAVARRALAEQHVGCTETAIELAKAVAADLGLTIDNEILGMEEMMSAL